MPLPIIILLQNKPLLFECSLCPLLCRFPALLSRALQRGCFMCDAIHAARRSASGVIQPFCSPTRAFIRDVRRTTGIFEPLSWHLAMMNYYSLHNTKSSFLASPSPSSSVRTQTSFMDWQGSSRHADWSSGTQRRQKKIVQSLSCILRSRLDANDQKYYVSVPALKKSWCNLLN